MNRTDPYFDYICDLALGKNKSNYTQLCASLYEIPFMYILDMDENRAVDGMYLRMEFINSHPELNMWSKEMCTVLEMMVALAKRCHESIIDAPGSGNNKSYELFGLMLENMGLNKYIDNRFNKKAVEKIVNNMLDRNYSADGKGSMFYIPGINHDMREAEIWYQAMWYIDSIMN